MSARNVIITIVIIIIIVAGGAYFTGYFDPPAEPAGEGTEAPATEG